MPWRATGTLVWLTALWLLLWHDWSVANALAGLAVGAAVLAFARLPRFERRPADERVVVRPAAAVRFALHTARDLLRANLTVARLVLQRRSEMRQGFITVPLRTDDELSMLVVVGLINLSPGTVAIDIVGEPPVVSIHVLHLDDDDAARREVLLMEELYIEAFGSRRSRRQLHAHPHDGSAHGEAPA